MPCCTRRLQSFSGAKWQHDVSCVVVIHRQQNWTLSADVIDEEANKSLALLLGNWSAMTGNDVVGGRCVAEADVDPSLTRATVVGFLNSLRGPCFDRSCSACQCCTAYLSTATGASNLSAAVPDARGRKQFRSFSSSGTNAGYVGLICVVLQ